MLIKRKYCAYIYAPVDVFMIMIDNPAIIKYPNWFSIAFDFSVPIDIVCSHQRILCTKNCQRKIASHWRIIVRSPLKPSPILTGDQFTIENLTIIHKPPVLHDIHNSVVGYNSTLFIALRALLFVIRRLNQFQTVRHRSDIHFNRVFNQICIDELLICKWFQFAIRCKSRALIIIL